MLTKCDNCDLEFEVPDSSFGQMILCQNCNHQFRALFCVEKRKNDLLGIAICNNCGFRHKINRKNEELIGKELKCSKCQEYFVVTLLDSNNKIESSEEQIQQDIKEDRIKQNIIKGFQKHHDRLLSIVSKGNRNESEVIRYCIDVIKDGLGYSDDEINTELKVLGKRVDIAIKKDGKIVIIIECKAANLRLTPSAMNQAVRYATNLGTEWAVVTNGHVWQLYRIIQRTGNEPDCIEVFEISLIDDDGISDYEIDCLYLLTSYSIESGDTDANAHFCACMSYKRFSTAMCSDEVILFICQKMSDFYYKETGVRVYLEKEDIEDYTHDIFDEFRY